MHDVISFRTRRAIEVGEADAVLDEATAAIRSRDATIERLNEMNAAIVSEVDRLYQTGFIPFRRRQIAVHVLVGFAFGAVVFGWFL